MRRTLVLTVLLSLAGAPAPPRRSADADTANRTHAGFDNPESAPWDGRSGSF